MSNTINIIFKKHIFNTFQIQICTANGYDT